MQPKTMLERFSDWINGEDVAAHEPAEAPARTVESILAECRRLWPDVGWGVGVRQLDDGGTVNGVTDENTGCWPFIRASREVWPAGDRVAARWHDGIADGATVREAVLAALTAEAVEQSRKACDAGEAVRRAQSAMTELAADVLKHHLRTKRAVTEIAALSGRA